jgi:hypothetical protein
MNPRLTTTFIFGPKGDIERLCYRSSGASYCSQPRRYRSLRKNGWVSEYAFGEEDEGALYSEPISIGESLLPPILL